MPAPEIAIRARCHVPWRPLIAASLLALIVGVLLFSGLMGRRSAVAPAVPHRGLSSLPLAAQGQISAALGADQRAFRASRTAGGFAASNPGQRLHARFERSGALVSSGPTTFGLSLRAVGYGSSLTPTVGAVTPSANANRVSYDHPGITEWYANGPLGLEQGFTIPRALSGHPHGPLTLSMALAGNAKATLAAGGQSLRLSHPGAASLRYGGLQARDARGRILQSWLTVRRGWLLLQVDVRGVRYPLRIDPFIQQAQLIPSNPSTYPSAGWGVALSADGKTALIGGPFDENGNGAAWVFTRPGATWTQQAKLTGAGEVGIEAFFGESVALSSNGNTALVAGAGDNNDAGAAWVFTRSGSTWRQQGEKLTSGETGELFGRDVALSSDGNTALTCGEGATGGTGGAWVFTRSGTTWTQQGAKLTRGERGNPMAFGASCTVSGDGNTALVGAPGLAGAPDEAGAAWVYTRSGETWTQQGEKLTGSGEIGAAHFGGSVALSRDSNTALVGTGDDNEGIGAAWVFTRSGETWTQQGEKLTGSGEIGKGIFGQSMALSADGNTALVGGENDNEYAGAAWAFTRSGTTWTQQGEKLTSGPLAAFGRSVALSGDGNTALIGEPSFGGNNGAAQVFVASPVVMRVKPDEGPGTGGTSVTVSGVGFTGTTAVKFGSTDAASFTVKSATSIVAKASAGRGTVDVTVTTPEGTSATNSADQFHYLPAVTKVSPITSPVGGGTAVTITGVEFTGATTVKFGAIEATSFTVNSDESITAASPEEAAGVVDVRVTTPEGTSPLSLKDKFRFTPTVTGLSRNTGPTAGGTTMTVTGTGFALGTTATIFKFGTATGTSVNCASTTECTVVSPAHAAGHVDVKATVNKVTSPKNAPADQFRYS